LIFFFALFCSNDKSSYFAGNHCWRSRTLDEFAETFKLGDTLGIDVGRVGDDDGEIGGVYCRIIMKD
jgi:hypothetical protein